VDVIRRGQTAMAKWVVVEFIEVEGREEYLLVRRASCTRY
jgi:hypothetical protein